MIEKQERVDEKPKKTSTVKARLYTIEQAAVYIGVSPRTLYNAVAPKSKKPFEIKPKRIGKRVLFDVQDLDRWIDTLGT